MDSSKDGMFEFHPDTVEAVRKDINLDKPGRIEEAVDLLEEWVKMQNHFLKKDFPRIYLETTLVTAKGLVERAKQKIDRLCTFRTLMPEFFPSKFAKEDFSPILSMVHQAHLPKLTKDHQRVYLMRLISDNIETSLIHIFYKYVITFSEYCKMNDYNSGFILVFDYRDTNILNFVTKFSPIELRQVLAVLTEGYGMRIKRIDIITASKMVDSLVSLFKQVLSDKIGGRIHVHKNLDTLHEAVGKDIMPEDYGGKEKPLKELNEKWLDIIFSKKNVEFFQAMNKAKTDESCRQADKFTEHYVGMPGSFRVLSVD